MSDHKGATVRFLYVNDAHVEQCVFNVFIVQYRVAFISLANFFFLDFLGLKICSMCSHK